MYLIAINHDILATLVVFNYRSLYNIIPTVYGYKFWLVVYCLKVTTNISIYYKLKI